MDSQQANLIYESGRARVMSSKEIKRYCINHLSHNFKRCHQLIIKATYRKNDQIKYMCELINGYLNHDIKPLLDIMFHADSYQGKYRSQWNQIGSRCPQMMTDIKTILIINQHPNVKSLNTFVMNPTTKNLITKDELSQYLHSHPLAKSITGKVIKPSDNSKIHVIKPRILK